MQTVAVLDYGMSNLRSVAKAVAHVGGNCRVSVTDRPEDVRRADRLIFPGQGAIGECMLNLRRLGLREAVVESVHNKPYLGICLGLQCLMDESEENRGTAGLGLIPGRVARFTENVRSADGRRLKIPHMGWNQVTQPRAHPLWQGIASGTRFYFVHSYYVEPGRRDDIAGSTDYVVPFAAAVARENVFAVQFHPEKSQRAGLQLLTNFLNWNP
ncbi:MAG TPA: imidazole glycerol phosphate synthase subunit HisH [Gammaproteobacteria bacterium]